jgi:hypothetical protein
MYSKGAYQLLIMKYDWSLDSWEEVKLQSIKNFEQLFWMMCIEIDKNKEKILNTIRASHETY